MSDDNFLARWSRRKRGLDDADQSAAERDAAAPPAAVRPDIATGGVAPAAAGEQPPAEADLSTLPPIDSIDAVTDVTGFLKKGVPLDLGRAALRRAWSSDPAIRDFVGLSENAWDFTDPNAIPGFGPLTKSPQEIAELVEQVFGNLPASEEQPAPVAKPAEPEPKADAPAVETPPPAIAGDQQPVALAQAGDTEASGAENQTELLRRTHGGALPR